MSPKQWLALLAFYVSYLFFGASVFYHFEHKLETERRSIAKQNQLSLNGKINYKKVLIHSYPNTKCFYLI